MKKYLIAFVFASILFVGVPHAKATTIDDLMLQLSNLTQQVADLKSQLNAAQASTGTSSSVKTNASLSLFANDKASLSAASTGLPVYSLIGGDCFRWDSGVVGSGDPVLAGALRCGVSLKAVTATINPKLSPGMLSAMSPAYDLQDGACLGWDSGMVGKGNYMIVALPYCTPTAPPTTTTNTTDTNSTTTFIQTGGGSSSNGSFQAQQTQPKQQLQMQPLTGDEAGSDISPGIQVKFSATDGTPTYIVPDPTDPSGANLSKCWDGRFSYVYLTFHQSCRGLLSGVFLPLPSKNIDLHLPLVVASGAVNAQTASQASTVTPLSFTHNLAYGEKSSEVKEFQQFLVLKGYLPAENATGFYGKTTMDATKKFQADNGIQGDGQYVGPKTRQVVLDATSPSPVPAAAPAAGTPNPPLVQQ